jgi:fibro-slime domain-containing protein
MVLLVAGAIVACSGDGTSEQTGAGGSGANSGSGTDSGNGGNLLFPTGGGGDGANASGAGNNENCGNQLTGVIRDFRSDHHDFEYVIATDRGIVEDTIGADQKPVYAGNPNTPTTNGQEAFDQWYRDTPGVNVSIPLTITLTESSPGIFTFQDGDFFPIDGQGQGNEGNPHNYHFTYEIHAEFTYEGGEVFTFTGDDDLFTFINGRLAIDLGGVHGEQTATIDLDAEADNLGITVGGTYNLDFFFAERHTSQSNFRIDTSIACFDDVPIPQ